MPIRLLILISLIYFLLPCSNCSGLEINKDFFKKNLETSVYAIDSEASAVVLYENFDISINYEAHGTGSYYSQTESVHRIIKILKPDAFNEANFSIRFPLDNFKNYVDKIQGTTYNLSGNEVEETKLNPADVYKKETSKYFYEYNFSLPAIREGSIIDVSYELVSPVEFYLPRWAIQGAYPKLISEYTVSCPDRFQFAAITHVRTEAKDYFSVKDAEMSTDDFCKIRVPFLAGATSSISAWVRKNIPAVKPEPYTITLQNFMENIELRLTGYSINNGFTPVDNNWDKINGELLRGEQFGKPINATNNFLNSTIKEILKTGMSEPAKIEAIYDYVRSNYKCIPGRGFYLYRGLKDVFDEKEGTETEINMLLTAILVHVGINAAPIIMSTTGNLSPSSAFPILNRFNYVACAVNIDSSYVLLDASDKNNTVGELPNSCYNGYARIISKAGAAINLATDLIKDKSSIVVKISGITDTAANVEITEKEGLVSSVSLRKSWAKKEDGEKSYIEDVLHNMPGSLAITDNKVYNEDNPDTNLVITYSGTLKLHKENGNIFMSASMIKHFAQNPFKSTVRKLPIEYPHQIQYQYYMSISLPADIVPSELPKPLSEDIANGGITLQKTYNYNADLHVLTVMSKFEVAATVYPTESYESIRNFYQQMIAAENEEIALKKIDKK